MEKQKKPPGKGAKKETPKQKPPAKGKAKKADAAKQEAPQPQPQPVNFAHLFTGFRRVRVKLGLNDYQRVMTDQQRLLKDISENRAKARDKERQISETQELLAKQRGELRELEGMVDEETKNILEIIAANKDGFHIEAVQVDEIFDKGEVITYKRGTKIELVRRNAQKVEHDAALEPKDAAGRLISRWAKGKPDGDGFVKIVGADNKERRVRGIGEWGYIGPDADPTKTPPADEKKKPGPKPKEEKAGEGGKVIPFSLEPKKDEPAKTAEPPKLFPDKPPLASVPPSPAPTQPPTA